MSLHLPCAESDGKEASHRLDRIKLRNERFMRTSEDDLGLGQREILANAWLAHLSADVFQGEPGSAAPGEQIDRRGQRAVLELAAWSNAGAVEPFVLEHGLQPGTERCGGQCVPTPVI